jgi:NAD(P)H-flavin reductase
MWPSLSKPQKLTDSFGQSVIGVSANHYVRNLSYRTFYLIHITLSSLLFPLMFFHVSHLRPYLWPSIVLFVGDQMLRVWLRTPALAFIKRLAPGLIEISAYAAIERPLKPGSHALIRHPDTAGILASNPFSITSAVIPSGVEKKRIRMISRVRGNVTKKLAALPTTALELCEASQSEPRQPLAIYLDLPYGAPLYFPKLENFDKILFIAGGVGATFAVSWVKYLLKSAEGQPALVKPGQLRFVWAVKTPSEVSWALKDDYPGDNGEDVAKCAELYITGAPKDLEAEDGDEEGGVEMTEGLLRGAGGVSTGGVDALMQAGLDKEQIFTGRPTLRKLIQDAVQEAGDEGRTAVLVCGPSMMGSIAKRVASRLGMDGADVWLHVEEFGH